MKIFKYIFIILLSISCSVHKKIPAPKNVAKLYNPSASKIHPAFSVYHNNETSSILFVKVFPKELLFSMANPEGEYKASFRVSFNLAEIDGKDNLAVDSGTFTYDFLRQSAEQRVIKQISIKAVNGKIYQLKVQAIDLIRKEEVIRYFYVDKRTEFSQQNFMIYDEKSQMPYFAPYVLGSAQFKIMYNNPDKYKSIFVSYYGQDMPLPKPSFTVTRENIYLSQPDSLWELPYDQNLSYKMAYEGMYFFQFDTTVKEGLTILNFGPDFPRVKNAEEMILPIAYISSQVEFDNVRSAINKKLAVDDFWLQKAEEADRARELIRIYYTRVFFSNYYFTTFKPGWMTDRGMIFIIYGPPQAIYVDVDKEKWMYYKKNYNSAITFIFDHVISPYTDNHYILERAESSEGYWKQAIDSWKSGKVFSIN